jgi:hypothetical protein
MIVRLVGADKLRKALATAQKRHEKGIERGLKKAGLYLQRMSMLIVPVQFGILRASAFTRHTGRGFQTEVRVGYTAAYAVFVHENPRAAHGKEFNEKHADKIAAARGPARKVWFNRGPNQQYKYLEKPLREGRNKMAQIVIDEARLTL